MNYVERCPKLIGVCLSTIQDEDRFNFIKSLNKYAVSSGYRLLIFNACTDLYEDNNSNYKGEGAVYKLIPYEKLSALVIMSNFIYDKIVVKNIIDGAKEHNVPLISIDKDIPGCINLSFSYSDTFERICRHVIETHGARKLYMIAGIKGNEFSDDRVSAFRRALEANDIVFEEDNIGYGSFWEGPTTDLLNQWFVTEHRPIPDAIICANDTMAVVASNYIQRLGFHVPDDCIITGFDGTIQAEYHLPHLTTCQQNYDEMGRRLTDTIMRVERGEECTGGTVDFHVKLSQSCGCVKMDEHNVNDSMRAILERFKQSSYRQLLMCDIQSTISKADDIKILPHILMDKFQFSTCVFALNTDVLSPPDFGERHNSDSPFTDEIDVLCHRYHWIEHSPCKVGLDNLLPDFFTITKRPEPIIICCLHFLGMVLGYCAFQPRIDFDEYEKMHTLMNAMNSSFGTFHSKMRIQYINAQLTDANEKLRVSSLHDFMTGLLNRRGFYSEAEKIIKAENTAGDMEIALIFSDLDGLKGINDNFGHNEGDNAIITLGHALLSSAVRGEVCARFGGDEFCVATLIPKGKAERYCEKFKSSVIDYLQHYNESSGKPYMVEASTGVYMRPLSSALDLEELVATADKLMYEEKMARKANRNEVHYKA